MGIFHASQIALMITEILKKLINEPGLQFLEAAGLTYITIITLFMLSNFGDCFKFKNILRYVFGIIPIICAAILFNLIEQHNLSSIIAGFVFAMFAVQLATPKKWGPVISSIIIYIFNKFLLDKSSLIPPVEVIRNDANEATDKLLNEKKEGKT